MKTATHLERHNLTYWQHRKRAHGNVRRLLGAAFKLYFHGWFPQLWQYAASDAVHDLTTRMAKKPVPHKIQIRFNKNWEQDEFKRRWRVIDNGVERLASYVEIRIMSYTDFDAVNVDGDDKYHMVCYGLAIWTDHYCYIKDA